MRFQASRLSIVCRGLLILLLLMVGREQVPAEKNSWKSIGLSGGGGMFSPAISSADRNLMMLNCDMGAAYISDDGGRNWRMINHSQLRSDTRCRPAFHPTDPNVIYASSRGELRVSRDRGHTFRPIGDMTERLYGEITINSFEPADMLIGARNGGCWLSHDSGATWVQCQGPTGLVFGFHFDSTRRGQTMFAATKQGIWRSDDSGRTWSEKTEGLPSREIQGFAGGSNADDGLVMLYCTVPSKLENGGLTGGVYCSHDRGETWKRAMGEGINTDTQRADRWAHGDISQYKQLLTTDTKPLTVYAMNTSTGFHPPHHETVYRTDDGGETWRDTYFMDPRFKQYNVAPNYVTASTGSPSRVGTRRLASQSAIRTRSG